MYCVIMPERKLDETPFVKSKTADEIAKQDTCCPTIHM